MGISRSALLLTLLLVLTACGSTTSTRVSSLPLPAAATAAPDDPTATVEQALTALRERDEATLTDLFDASVGTLANPLAYGAIARWRALTARPSASAFLTSVALGPAQAHTTQPPDTSGTTTRVVALVTHDHGDSRWTFTLRQGAHGWRLTAIVGSVLTKR